MMRPLLLPLALLSAAPAWAEVELSFYGGWQGAPDGEVSVGGGDVAVDGGASGQAGLRATWWGEGGFGIALDYSHFGIEAEGEAPAAGFAFDGLDTLTVSGMHRWEDAFGEVTPYVGAGLGVAVGDLETAADPSVQGSGLALSWVAGASVPVGGNWSVFGEYEGTFSQIEGDIGGGGSVEAETVTNSINLGVSFSF